MSNPEHLGQFSRVDEASDPRAFVGLLDQLRAQAGERKSRTYQLMRVRPADTVLDIGCGTGADVVALARLVGPQGRAVGVDLSETMVREARERAAGLELPIDFRREDALHLSFDDRHFDACRCERVLEHLEKPDEAVREMVRVAKPGARVVAYEPDWGTIAMDSPDDELTERIAAAVGRGVRNGRIGRRLRRLFLEAGLEDVETDADVWTLTDFELTAQLLRLEDVLRSACEAGVVASSEVDTWLGSARRAGRANRFLGSLTFFYAAGRKPAAQPSPRGWTRVALPSDAPDA